MELDRQAILNGTPSKLIKRAYEDLKANYSKASSLEFYNLYKAQDLNTIFNNSRYIFAEPYRGLGFFTHVVTSVQHLDQMMTEYTKLLDYYAEFKNSMDNEQKASYEESIEFIGEYISDLEPIFALKAMLLIDVDTYENQTINNDYSIVDELYTQYYKIEDVYCREDEYDDFYNGVLNHMKELLFEIDNLCFMPDIINIFTRNFELSVILYKYLRDIYINNPNTLEEYCRDVYMSNVLRRMLVSTKIRRRIEYCPHEQLRLKLLEIAYTPDEILINKLKEKTISGDEIVYAGTKNAVNDIFFGADLNDTLYKDSNEETKKDIVATESAMLSIVSDFITYDLITEGANSDINVESSLLGFYNEAEGADYQQYNRKSEINNILSDKAMVLYEDGIDFNHEDNQPKATVSNKPVKPKMSLNRKIQEKGIDNDIKSKKTAANMKKAKQEVKNTVKAVTKIPSGVVNSGKEAVSSWDQMDDDKRKEYISKPGNRKKVFKILRIALTYYITAIVNPLLTISYFIYRSFSKEKDVRIRNELSHELEAEIKICEEKINDANSQGDNKKKYELIRIKDKLDAELVRVRANSSYI